MRTAVFVDGRNMLDPQAMRDAGFRYDAIGRAASNGIVVMEAIVLAGGKAERLGDAADGRPEVARSRRWPPAPRLADRPSGARRRRAG